MPDFTARITEILREHFCEYIGGTCLCGKPVKNLLEHSEHVSAIVARAAEENYRPRIESPEQLAALPIGSVVAHTESQDDRTEYRKFGPYVWGKFGDSRMYSAPPIYKHTPLRLLWSPGAGK